MGAVSLTACLPTVLTRSGFLRFVFETETAVALLEEGIGHIASWDGGDDRRIVALHLLAQDTNGS